MRQLRTGVQNEPANRSLPRSAPHHRTLKGWLHGDHFIDLLRNGFAVMLSIGRGLAPGWFWVRFPLAPGKRCGLPLVGTLGFLPLPPPLRVLLAPSFPFSLQLLALLPQLRVFVAQPLIVATCSVPLLPQ